MTNVQIIAINEAELIKDGKMEEYEELHTYAHWKQLGFSVKKGEKAITKFPIWKYSTKTKKASTEKDNSDDTTDEKNSYCFMKMSAFFKTSQVEPLKAE